MGFYPRGGYPIEFYGLNIDEVGYKLRQYNECLRGLSRNLGDIALQDDFLQEYLLEVYKRFIQNKFNTSGGSTRWREHSPWYSSWLLRHGSGQGIMVGPHARLKNALINATIQKNRGSGYSSFRITPSNLPVTRKGYPYLDIHQNWGGAPFGFRRLTNKPFEVIKPQGFLDPLGDKVWTNITLHHRPVDIATRKILPEQPEDQQVFVDAITSYIQSDRFLSQLPLLVTKYLEGMKLGR